jgi:hypothetical protein
MKRVALVVLLLGFGACAERALDTGPTGNGSDAAAGTGGGGTGGASMSTGAAGASMSTGGAGASTSTGGAGASISMGSSAGASTPGVALACAATCETPAGPATTLSSNGAMVGRWEICSSRDDWAKVGAPVDTIGVEYTPDGHMYYLIAGPAGPVRGVGFAYQLTYDVLSTGQLNMHPAPNAGFFGTVSVSPCPRELHIAPFAYDTPGTMLVPFDYDPTVTPPPAPMPGGPACVATCATPAGEVKAFSTVDEVYAAMAGRWVICEGVEKWKNSGAPTDVVGFEFGPASSAPGNGSTVGGNLYFLVEGPSGLVRAASSSYQPTYALWPQPPFQLDLRTGPNAGRTVTARYSPCPRELELPGMGEPNTILIPAL